MGGIGKSDYSFAFMLVAVVSLATILTTSSVSVAQIFHIDKGSQVVYHAYLRTVSEDDPGTVHVLITNTSSSVVTIRRLCLNGYPVRQTPDDFVYWQRTVPHIAKPGEIMDVMLKLRRVTNKPLRLNVILSDGSQVSTVVDAEPDRLTFSFVGYDLQANTAYLYLRNQYDRPLRIRKVLCNLNDITSRCWIPEHTVASNSKMLIIFHSHDKLCPGDYLAFKVLTDQEAVAVAQTRVYSYFPITAFFGDTRTELGFDEVPFDMPFPSSQEEFVGSRNQPSHRVYHVFNDPACNDGRARKLVGTNMTEVARRTAECYEKDHVHPSLVYLCHHLHPFSYCIYGEAADIIAVDPYEMQNRQDQPLKDAEYVALAKKAAEPRLLWCIPEAWTDPSRQRFPTPEEERIIVYSEIGEGARGVWYFSAKRTSGYRGSLPLEVEVGRINRELRCLRDYLMIGESFPIASVNSDKARVYPILCGDKGIVLILMNLDHLSSFEKNKPAFVCSPQEDLTIQCDMPEWFRPAEVLSVEDGELSKLDYRRAGSTMTVSIGRLEITKQILIRGGRQ